VIIDTSVIIAIMKNEADAEDYRQRLAMRDDSAKISAASYLEAAIVVDRAEKAILSERLDQLLAEEKIDIVPFTAAQSRIARAAYRQYGKGSSHPAQLNFGDCFAYALAKDSGEALLFKGDDFSRTDVVAALS
jgi:ribonuclease VapC